MVELATCKLHRRFLLYAIFQLLDKKPISFQKVFTVSWSLMPEETKAGKEEKQDNDDDEDEATEEVE